MCITKTCTKCKEVKDVKLFEKGKSRCKICRKERYKSRYLRNIDRYKDRSKKRYIEIYGEAQKEKSKIKVKELDDYYVKYCIRIHLKNTFYNPTPEMIELYRSMMILKREKLNFTKQVKQELNIKSL